MTPTRTEIVLALLDDVLAEKFGGDKVQNLRQIEHAAKRMADGIEMVERDRERWRARHVSVSQETIEPARPTKDDVIELALCWLNTDAPLSDEDFYRRMCGLFTTTGSLRRFRELTEAEVFGYKTGIEDALAVYLERLPINDIQRATMGCVYDLIKGGSKAINLTVRKDGQEYHFEADWLRPLLRDLDRPTMNSQGSAASSSPGTDHQGA